MRGSSAGTTRDGVQDGAAPPQDAARSTNKDTVDPERILLTSPPQREKRKQSRCARSYDSFYRSLPIESARSVSSHGKPSFSRPKCPW